MAIQLGVHIGSVTHGIEDVLEVYRKADQAGLYWVSVSDHFYRNPMRTDADREIPCYEGVALMSAVSAITTQARVGCMMFCSLFRNPGLLAKSIVTIDHISGGRAELGMGAGWYEQEFNEFGYGFPPAKERMDQFEEGLQIVRALLRDGGVDFKGEYYTMQGAVCAPRPLNPKLRIWIGGRGPKRTPRMAAQYADGFNTPYLDPPDYKERLDTLDAACEKYGRDPAEIMRSVNVHFLMGANEAGAERGRKTYNAFEGAHRGGALLGTKQEAIDRIGEYERVGAQGLNIAFRPPVDWEAYLAFLEEVVPVFKGKN